MNKYDRRPVRVQVQHVATMQSKDDPADHPLADWTWDDWRTLIDQIRPDAVPILDTVFHRPELNRAVSSWLEDPVSESLCTGQADPSDGAVFSPLAVLFEWDELEDGSKPLKDYFWKLDTEIAMYVREWFV